MGFSNEANLLHAMASSNPQNNGATYPIRKARCTGP
jgi:hypothetical protein